LVKDEKSRPEGEVSLNKNDSDEDKTSKFSN
jgi:hypothetical protein